jgi:hypothetical protein
MKGLLAWIVGATLVATSTGAPRVIADENGEVHYWSSGTSYVPEDEAKTTYVSQGKPVQFVDVSDDASAPGDLTSPMPALHGHVYLINDDPGYDLTGPSDHWFLMGDGTAFRDENWHGTGAAFASTGMMAGHEVVPITAEFRQDWLAVAAGDRPVRTFTAPRSTAGAGVMAVVPMENTTSEPMAMNQYSSAEPRDTFRPVHHARAHRTYHATRPVRYTSTHRERTTNYQTASVEPAANTQEAVETEAQPAVEVSQDRMGHELFQMGTSWYMKVDKDWYRAESWRGPFAPIKKRTVPREVKMSAKHPSRMDMD